MPFSILYFPEKPIVSTLYLTQLCIEKGNNHLGRGILIAIHPIQGFFRRIKNIFRRVVAAICEILLKISSQFFADMLE